MNPDVCIAAAIAVFGMLVASPASSCSGDKPDAKALAAPGVSSDAPLFVFDKQGRLFRAGFDGRAWKLLSDHGEGQHIDNLELAGDYVLFERSEPGTSTRTWLFRMSSGREREVPGKGYDARLSPDARRLSRKLQISDDEYSWVAVVQSTRNLRTRRYLLPDQPRVLDGGEIEYSSLDWTEGGDLVWSVGSQPRRFHVLVEAKGAFVAAQGRMDSYPEVFHRGRWSRIRMTIDELPEFRFPASNSSDQRAEVGEGEVLRVRDALGGWHPVARGRYDECGGSNIGVYGWADEQRLLVYELDEVAFVYDTRSHRSAPLFSDPARVEDFFWPGLDRQRTNHNLPTDRE